MEICSEAPNYQNDWPSGITLWINDVECGTWTSPGDFGGALEVYFEETLTDSINFTFHLPDDDNLHILELQIISDY